jgi:phosphatidylglycerophosphatase C
MRPIAVFDFDHTLTDRDSLLPFLFDMRGFRKTILHLAALTPSFLRYLLGNISRQSIKEKILTRFLGGVLFTELQSFGQHYADHRLDHFLKPQALQRLVWHQAQGHRCILVSASVEVYLKPWGIRHGFEEVLASRLELSSTGNVTGRLIGLNCWGPEKKRRLLNYLGTADQGTLYVYGDSRGDHDLLAIADHPFYRKFSFDQRLTHKKGHLD